jgi:HEXXH motif-containing protein
MKKKLPAAAPLPPATGSPADFVTPAADLRTLKASHRFYQKELLRETLRLSRRVPGGVVDSAPPLYGLIRRAAEKNPQALLDSLSAPSVAAAVWSSAKSGKWPALREKIAESRRSLVARLLLEMALRDLLPEEGAAVDFPCDLASPAFGAVLKPQPGAGGWRFKNGFAGIGTAPMLRLASQTLTGRRPTSAGLASELAYVPIGENIRLALVDFNPLAQIEAHPDKDGNALSLGGRSEEDWRAALVQALQWILEFWPELYREMEFLLCQIVPVGSFKDKHNSASYLELVGTVYMSLHHNPLTMTEALIHEFQHNKLNMASYADPLLENGFFPLYKSPLRPDPRPLWGLFLGAHAFLPVAAFLRRMSAASHALTQTPDFEKRLADIDKKNREAMETLAAHGRWTPAGRKIMEAMTELSVRHAAPR